MIVRRLSPALLASVALGTVADAQVRAGGAAPWVFKEQLDLPALPGNLLDLEVGDFDRDGRTELLVPSYVSPSSAQFHVFEETQVGANDFTWCGASPLPFERGRAIGTFVRLVPADLDGDGLTEIAVGHYGHGLRTYRLDATSSHYVEGSYVNLDDAQTRIIEDLEIAHLDGDGVRDVAVVRLDNLPPFVSRQLKIIESGRVIFQSEASFPMVTDLTSGNLDGDAHTDLIMGHPGQLQSFSATWVEFNGQTFETRPLALAGVLGAPLRVRCADMDLDGVDELVVAGVFDGVRKIMVLQVVDGQLESLAETTYDAVSTREPLDLDVRDVMEDERPEIAVATAEELHPAQAYVYLYGPGGLSPVFTSDEALPEAVSSFMAVRLSRNGRTGQPQVFIGTMNEGVLMFEGARSQAPGDRDVTPR